MIFCNQFQIFNLFVFIWRASAVQSSLWKKVSTGEWPLRYFYIPKTLFPSHNIRTKKIKCLLFLFLCFQKLSNTGLVVFCFNIFISSTRKHSLFHNRVDHLTHFFAFINWSYSQNLLIDIYFLRRKEQSHIYMYLLYKLLYQVTYVPLVWVIHLS